MSGGPPTWATSRAAGKRVTGGGIAIERFPDGKKVERWAQPDRAGLMQQLGLFPAPSVA
jgi:predicted ester cyclase